MDIIKNVFAQADRKPAMPLHRLPIYKKKSSLFTAIGRVCFMFAFSYYLCVHTSSCTEDVSQQIVLGDKWEGSKKFIICELEVDKNAEVTITKTINPIFSEKQPIAYVTELDILLLKNNIVYDTLKYDNIENKYLGNKPVVSNNTYKLIISKDQDTIRSKSLHVPAEAYKVSPILKTVSKDSINIRLKIYFDQYAEGILEAYMFVVDSRILFQGRDQDDNVVKSTSPCFKERIIDIACLKKQPIDLYLSVKYDQRNTIDHNTYLEWGIKHFSPELRSLRDGKLSPYYGLHNENIIKTSFEGAYGVFGYSQNTTIKELLIQ